MRDAQAPLQAGITAAIKGDAALNALIGGRIYDRVPTNANNKVTATFPYASFGPFSTAAGGGSCDTGVEIDVQIDGWSRAVGTVEAKQIGAALLARLTEPFDVEGFETTIVQLRGLSGQPGLDGLTSQSVLRLRFSLSPKP